MTEGGLGMEGEQCGPGGGKRTRSWCSRSTRKNKVPHEDFKLKSIVLGDLSGRVGPSTPTSWLTRSFAQPLSLDGNPVNISVALPGDQICRYVGQVPLRTPLSEN